MKAQVPTKRPHTRIRLPDPAPEPVAAATGEVETPTGETAAVTTAATRPPRRNPGFPIGVNYYPLDAETQGWDDWYAGDVAADFEAFARERLTLARVFVSWKYFEPQVGQYSDLADERLQEIVDAARANQVKLIVCFFADDRLADMLDVMWGKRRDPRGDQYLIQRQAALVQRIVNRYRAEETIFAWDLANEAFCAGFTSAEQMSEWVSTLRDAVREIDQRRPVMVSTEPETLFRLTGVDAKETLAGCEIGVSHVTAAYRAYAAEGPPTSGPSTYLDAFLLHSASRAAPIILDDAGVHSLDQSHAEEAVHLRCALYSGLMNRAAGVLVRRWRDLDAERREPYFRDPFEVLVGVHDTHGAEKPTMGELREFARTVAHIDLTRYSLTQERTAIVIPAERYNPLPDLASLYDPRACLQAFVAAKQAHVPVTVVHESETFAPYTVLIVPSAFRLDEVTWERLASFVQGGGSLICSYGGGDIDAAARELFGVEFLGDDGPRSRLSCRVAQPDLLGQLVSFDATLETPSFALLGQAGATIVATDATGSPLLTLDQHGQGRAVLCAAPLERAIAQGDPWAAPAAITHLLRTVYGAVARSAGCGSPVGCDQPAVELALFTGEDDGVVVTLNHGREPVTATLSFERAVADIADVRGGPRVRVYDTAVGVPLEGGGVKVMHFTYA